MKAIEQYFPVVLFIILHKVFSANACIVLKGEMRICLFIRELRSILCHNFFYEGICCVRLFEFSQLRNT